MTPRSFAFLNISTCTLREKFLSVVTRYFTATSHDRHGAFNRCLLNSLFSLITNKTSKLHITGPLPNKGPGLRKATPCHGVTMFVLHKSWRWSSEKSSHKHKDAFKWWRVIASQGPEEWNSRRCQYKAGSVGCLGYQQRKHISSALMRKSLLCHGIMISHRHTVVFSCFIAAIVSVSTGSMWFIPV